MSDIDVNDPAVIEVYEDYFGFGEERQFKLPDGKQYISFQIMNEGQRSEFQKRTNRDIRINRASGDASIKADPAEERRALITSSVVGWNLKRRKGDGWEDVTFSKGSAGASLEKWLVVANPKIIDDLEFAIRKANPWLQSDMTVEEIDKEMDRLRELREQTVERERGEELSSSK